MQRAVPPPANQEDSAVHVQLGDVAEVEKFRVEWKQFLDHLLKKNLKVIVTHLRVCELRACSGGVLYMSCARKFSYEELLQDVARLSREIDEFYGLPVKLTISYDAEKDASTREQTVFTLFRELSEKNDVLKFIIREFGGELVY